MALGGLVKKRLGKLWLKLTGWSIGGLPPKEHRKFVLIAAPHTSNWDLVYTLAIAWALDVKVKWIGKRQLFRFPFGWMMRKLGGIAVNRDRRENVVQASAALFKQYDDLILTVPAEGTRSRVAYWKSGFYYIAKTANVPIVLGFLDYGKKSGGFGPALLPSGNLKTDMDKIRAFYAPILGKYPAQFATPRLKGEDDAVTL